jgi:vitamin B12 transporter
MRSPLRSASHAAAVALASSIAAAVGAQQTDTARVPAMIVTATRVPVTIDNSPSSVTVLSGEALEREGVQYVADALRRVPGVAIVQTGSFGGNTSLFLRGGESKYVKVLVDGIAVNDPGGPFDFGSLTTDNVERIEIVRGPASVLYGADAVTGVVQIFTKRGAGKPHVTVAARGGGYGTRDVSADATGALGGGDYSLGVAQHYTTGIYEFNNAFRNNVLSGAMHLAPDDRTNLRLSLRYADDAAHYPTDFAGTPLDSNSMRSETRTELGIDATRALGERVSAHLALASHVTGGGTDDQPEAGRPDSFVSVDDIRRRSASLSVDARLPRGTTFSVGIQREQEDERSESSFASGSFQSTSVFTASRLNDAVFAQLLASPLSRATITMGARYDHNERFGSFETYRAATNISITSTTRLRGSVGNAFREPTFSENYATGFVIGNPSLEPERTTSWEAGLQQYLFAERVLVGVTHFDQRFRQMIDYTGDTSACGASYCNIARARSSGQELEARALLPFGITADANFTHLDTRVLQAGFDTTSGGLFLPGQQLVRRPRTSWSLGVAWFDRSGASADVRVNHVGSRTDKNYSADPVETVVLDEYSTIDASAEIPLVPASSGRPTAAATLRVNNLTDEKYVSVFGYQTPRRQFLGGIRLNF